MDISICFGYCGCNKTKKGAGTMEMKNLCGKIPVDHHLKVRAEIEQREISTQQFIQQVIEEHFMEKIQLINVNRKMKNIFS